MTDTIFNISLGKHSFKTTKLPAPNEHFILNQEKVNLLDKAPGNKDWWKPYLYQLSNGNKCFGLSSDHQKALESIGLTVLVP
tara:strand:+ start:1577 stop:1822 length:246 start_codon:yes stop_codon:yes gene_type:complete